MHRQSLTTLSLSVLLALPAVAFCADAANGDKDLEGTWEQQSLVRDGKEVPPPTDGSHVLTIQGDSATVKMGGEARMGAVKVDMTKTPKTIDITPQGGPDKDKPMKGVYEVKGDELRICIGGAGKDRPTELVSKEGGGNVLITFKRVKK